MVWPLLLKLAKYAIEGNFGKSQKRKAKVNFDLHDQLHKLPRRDKRLAPSLRGIHCLGLDISPHADLASSVAFRLAPA